MKVILYGRLADTIGSEVHLQAPPGASVGEVRRLLAVEHPATAATLASRRSVACIGGSVVRDDHVIGEGDLLEFLPPVSGG